MSSFADRLFRLRTAARVTIADTGTTILPEAAYATTVLVLQGTLTATRTLEMPHEAGPAWGGWVIANITNQAITLRGPTGAGVSVPSGGSSLVFSDGSDYRTIGPSGATTLGGDLSGASPTNAQVTNVTGAANTKVNGTTTVALRVGATDVVTVDATSVSIGSPLVSLLASSTAGGLTPSAPDGSLGMVVGQVPRVKLGGVWDTLASPGLLTAPSDTQPSVSARRTATTNRRVLALLPPTGYSVESVTSGDGTILVGPVTTAPTTAPPASCYLEFSDPAADQHGRRATLYAAGPVYEGFTTPGTLILGAMAQRALCPMPDDVAIAFSVQAVFANASAVVQRTLQGTARFSSTLGFGAGLDGSPSGWTMGSITIGGIRWFALGCSDVQTAGPITGAARVGLSYRANLARFI